ncbi:MAG: DUF4434 domain-containing protein [Verrucomicrobia bacterium]|nr:DUF4434 domain-containing protein [Verrucomicrobiota bacterium]
MKRAIQITFVLLALTGAQIQAGEVSGTFIQLNRKVAQKSAEEWTTDFEDMKAVGLDTVIVQWTAQKSILYFRWPAPEETIPFTEQYDAVERILDAAEATGFKVYLGLQNDPDFWRQITSRDQVLRDYFLVRVAQNERLQAGLLAAFGGRSCWTGYYITEELDDLSWRLAPRRQIVKLYLDVLSKRLRANDGNRNICVSSFYRARTAPDLFASNLEDIVEGADIDHVLIQDGVGVGNPPQAYVPIYFEALKNMAAKDKPDLWAVIESFKQVSAGDEPFKAEPTDTETLKRQIAAASEHFEHMVFFTFLDYMSPSGDEKARKLYEMLNGGSGNL